MVLPFTNIINNINSLLIDSIEDMVNNIMALFQKSCVKCIDGFIAIGTNIKQMFGFIWSKTSRYSSRTSTQNSSSSRTTSKQEMDNHAVPRGELILNIFYEEIGNSATASSAATTPNPITGYGTASQKSWTSNGLKLSNRNS